MKSIRELYKIGYGPSSSHTMGPQKACEMFHKKYPDCSKFRVILYGSLALTGKGHLTDVVIKKTLGNVEVMFDKFFPVEHPNTMEIYGCNEGGEIAYWKVYSVGGGAIKIEGEEKEDSEDIYPHHSFDEIKAYCESENLRLYEYVERFEGKEIWLFLEEILQAMMNAIDRGLHTEGVLPGRLKVQRKAKQLLTKVPLSPEPVELTQKRLVSAYAYAASEENASGGIVVTAPTCGASGIVPAVLKYIKERNHFDTEAAIHALATAGLMGNIIKHNASISGAVAGCQAEVGSACSMAAAMTAEFYKLSIHQIEYAAEIAMEHHLGLTCDPIFGYVQIPCIERNAVAALRAIDACSLAYFLSESRKISFDMVVETMYQTGKDLHTKYRETGIGGLAQYYSKIKR